MSFRFSHFYLPRTYPHTIDRAIVDFGLSIGLSWTCVDTRMFRYSFGRAVCRPVVTARPSYQRRVCTDGATASFPSLHQSGPFWPLSFRTRTLTVIDCRHFGVTSYRLSPPRIATILSCEAEMADSGKDGSKSMAGYTACGAKHADCPQYGKCDEDGDKHPTYHHCGSCGKHWIK